MTPWEKLRESQGRRTLGSRLPAAQFPMGISELVLLLAAAGMLTGPARGPEESSIPDLFRLFHTIAKGTAEEGAVCPESQAQFSKLRSADSKESCFSGMEAHTFNSSTQRTRPVWSR